MLFFSCLMCALQPVYLVNNKKPHDPMGWEDVHAVKTCGVV